MPKKTPPTSQTSVAKVTTKGQVTAPKKVVVEKQVPVDYSDAEHIQSTYANMFAIQSDIDEFHFLFFEAMKPVFIQADPDVDAKIAAFNVMKPKCVAKIALSPQKAAEILVVLQRQVANHVVRSQGVTVTVVKGATGSPVKKGE